MADERNTLRQKRSESLRASQRLCFEHAADLINAARMLLDADQPLPNIAFHLSALALEEIGKAGLLASREVSKVRHDESWFEKRLEDHEFKLFWALWAPLMNGKSVDPSTFESTRRFSEQIHARRLAGLYVDWGTGEQDAISPKSAVSLGQAKSLLDLAAANLELHSSRGSPDLDTDDEVAIWFLQTIADEAGKCRLFSPPFIKKLEELDGDVHAWAKWAKEEFLRIKKEEDALLKFELSRTSDGKVGSTPRWRLTIRLYCASHSIRQKTLTTWNDTSNFVKLKFAKSNELLLEIDLPNSVNVVNVYDTGLTFTKLVVACLNIGTAGFFWFELSSQSKRYFEKVEDLANKEFKLELEEGRGLERHWMEFGPKRLVLEGVHLAHAAKCAAVFGAMKDDEAEPIFGPYLAGLSLLSKSDVHLSLDDLAFREFDTALRTALKSFGDWDGEEGTLLSCLHRMLSPVIPEEEHRDILLRSYLSVPKSWVDIQDHAVAAKRLADVCLVQAADREFGSR